MPIIVVIVPIPEGIIKENGNIRLVSRPLRIAFSNKSTPGEFPANGENNASIYPDQYSSDFNAIIGTIIIKAVDKPTAIDCQINFIRNIKISAINPTTPPLNK